MNKFAIAIALVVGLIGEANAQSYGSDPYGRNIPPGYTAPYRDYGLPTGPTTIPNWPSPYDSSYGQFQVPPYTYNGQRPCVYGTTC